MLDVIGKRGATNPDCIKVLDRCSTHSLGIYTQEKKKTFLVYRNMLSFLFPQYNLVVQLVKDHRLIDILRRKIFFILSGAGESGLITKYFYDNNKTTQ